MGFPVYGFMRLHLGDTPIFIAFYCLIASSSTYSGIYEESSDSESVFFVIVFVSARLVGIDPCVWFKQLDVQWVRNWIYGDIKGYG